LQSVKPSPVLSQVPVSEPITRLRREFNSSDHPHKEKHQFVERVDFDLIPKPSYAFAFELSVPAG
jgi:hypothetical protein